MNKSLLLEFFHSLKRNLSRFLSILLIIALGVAFFAGINATKPDMIQSAAQYFKQQNLSDLRARNPLGYTSSEMERIKTIPGISHLESGYTSDLMMKKGEEEATVRLYSLAKDQRLNKNVVTEGRLPEQSGEIAMAKGKYLDLDLKIGDKVQFISPTVTPGVDPKAIVKAQPYTLVGFIESPLYVSVEREYTNVGSGTITTYVAVLKEDFVLKEATEIFFQVAGTQDLSPVSPEYKNKVSAVQDKLEDFGKEVMSARTADLRKTLSDNEAKLASEKAKMEEELAKGADQLAKAEEEITQGKVTLASEEAKGREKIAKGRAEIASQRQKLIEGREKYVKGLSQWQEGNQKYLAGEAKWQEGNQKYLSGKATYDAKVLELSAGKSQLDTAKATMEQSRAMIKQSEGQMASAKTQLDDFKKVLDGLRTVSDNLGSGPNLSQEQFQDVIKEVEKFSPDSAKLIERLVPDTFPQPLSRLKDALDLGLDTIQARYDASKAQYNAGQAQLISGKAQLAKGEKDYEEGLAKYEQGKIALQGAEADLAKAKKEVDQGRKTLDAAKAEVDAGKNKLDESLIQLEEGQGKLDQGALDLDNGEKVLEEKIKENKEKLAQGEQDLAAGKKTYAQKKAKGEAEIAKASDKLLKARRQIADIPDHWLVSNRDGNPGYTTWFDNADRIGRVALIFPAFFFLIAALVSLTTITRMVEEERGQIGTLKAMGYSTPAIAAKYLLYALLAGLLGAILGLMIGFQLFPRIIITAYGMMYSIPPLVVAFNGPFALLSLFIALLCTLGAALAASLSEVRAVPAQLMQPKAPPAGQKIFLEKIPALWSRLSFSRKVTFRNLFLYKKRFWMTVLGIAGCTALLLTGFGLKDSVDAIVHNQFSQLHTYDLQVKGDTKLSAEARNLEGVLKNQDGVKDSLLLRSENMKAHAPGSDRNYSMVLMMPKEVDRLGAYIQLKDPASKKAIPLTDEGVVVSQKVAELLNLKVGEPIYYRDGDNREFKAPVAAITENYLSNYLYISPKLYEEVHLMKPDYDNALVHRAQGMDQKTLQNKLMDQPGVSFVVNLEQISDSFNDQMGSLVFVVGVLILSAGTLAFIVLYNLSNVNITERLRELATIKVLGFHDKEVSAYVYRENIILTILGALFGTALGIFLHGFIMKTMEFEDVMFGKQIQPLSFILAFLLTFLFSALVNAIMHFVLKKIDMVDSLKSME